MSSAGSNRFYYRSEGTEEGPVSGEKLLELFETHMITAFDEVRADGETAWMPAQQVVGGILEAKKKGGARARPAPSAGGAPQGNDGAQAGGGSTAQPELVILQRGAPAPKPKGSITDQELAQSIAYANAEARRSRLIRGAVSAVLFLVALGAGVHFSTNLRAVTPAPETTLRVDTRIVIESANALMESPRGQWRGTGLYALTRVRDVTRGSDGTVSMVMRDESSRWRADLEGGPDHSELRPGLLRGQTVTFAPAELGWSAALDGIPPTSKQTLKLQALAFDNSVLYPERRLWPWPWQSWQVPMPEACSVFALDIEGCKAELSVKFRGFAPCGTERCARLTFEGKWEGLSEGDRFNLQLTGEVLRSPAEGVDVSVQANGDLTVQRTIEGPTASSTATLSGKVTVTQTTGLAE